MLQTNRLVGLSGVVLKNSRPLTLHPDRLLPPGDESRGIARELYAGVQNLPIISPHSHVPADLIFHNYPFSDPSSLLITSDHYVTRVLHAAGVPYGELIAENTGLSEDRSRRIWRTFCALWDKFRGTATRYWLEVQLVELFGVNVQPSTDTADFLYDQISECLQSAEFTPRSLYERFRVSVIATTDDPSDDLAAHRALFADPGWGGRVIPTYRPDRYFEMTSPHWNEAVDKLHASADIDDNGYDSFVQALIKRREYFKVNGATATDHGQADARIAPLQDSEARAIFDKGRAGLAVAGEARAFGHHMLYQMATMSAADGLVMMLHPGVLRNHHAPTYTAYGPDTGHDIPVATEYTRALQPVLNEYGTHPNFQLVLFTVDPSTFSREIAPLAGFYPAVYAGAPWWFLDSPEMTTRYWDALTEIAGFARASGFIDDTRALCSLPARHDMSRRITAAYLAGKVAQHRMSLDDAHECLRDLVIDRPMETFKLNISSIE